MKRRKGFTLIELLAVIVILAVIALIATPLIMNTINDAKDSSMQRSVQNIQHAVEQHLMSKKVLDENYIFTISDFNYKGEKYDKMNIKFNEKDEAGVTVYKDNKCYYVLAGTTDVVIDKDLNETECLDKLETKIKLPTPEVSFQDNTLTITPVENADGYEIYSGEELLTSITETEVDLSSLLATGTYTIGVKALGSGTFKHSDLTEIECKVLGPGLYDANDNLLATWDVLIAPVDEGGYGLDVETDYTSSNCNTETSSMGYLLNNKNELKTGVKLIMGEGPTKIGDYVFYYSELTSISLSSNITTIGAYAFAKTSIQNISLPEGVTTIKKSAFWSCWSLETITIPNSVTTIDTAAFMDCKSLESITVPSKVTTIGVQTFENCTSLQKVTFSENSKLTLIDNYAFGSCTSLESITIPENVTTIDELAFSGCTSLKNIMIPEGITTIGFKTFNNCSALTNVYYSGTEANWAAININATGNDYLKNATIHYESTGPTE